MSRSLIELEGLSQFFEKKPQIRAVEGINLTIEKGETLGLVGESGCGKTTLGRAILRLYEPTAGKIRYDGETIFDDTKKTQPDMRPYRRKMQMIFQNPAAALDPRMTIGESIGQALDIHHMTNNAAERTESIARLLRLLELPGKANHYPHECSGGQQQ
ncbi:MAG: ATP-binding cassette domain-containing protein, partial [Evtepia sp.]